MNDRRDVLRRHGRALRHYTPRIIRARLPPLRSRLRRSLTRSLLALSSFAFRVVKAPHLRLIPYAVRPSSFTCRRGVTATIFCALPKHTRAVVTAKPPTNRVVARTTAPSARPWRRGGSLGAPLLSLRALLDTIETIHGIKKQQTERKQGRKRPCFLN